MRPLIAVCAGSIVASCLLLAEPKSTSATGVEYFHSPLLFTVNNGQWDDEARFSAQSRNVTIWFTADGVVYEFVRGASVDESGIIVGTGEQHVLTTSFPGSNPDAFPEGLNEQVGKSNYFLGNDPSLWRTNVPNYQAVLYRDIYPGIDLKYFGDHKRLEYDFIVSPGADASQIAVRYDGAESLEINDRGELVVCTGKVRVIEKKPRVYQIIDDIEVAIECAYWLLDKNTFTFQILDDYNEQYAVVFDPIVSFASFWGGSATDGCYSIARDGLGYIYILSQSVSGDIFLTNVLGSPGGTTDLLVCKFNPTGDTVIYSTKVAGSSTDAATELVLDGAEVIACGLSSSLNFPVVAAYDPSPNGAQDVVLFKLSSDGSALVFSTYFGGTAADGPFAMTRAGDGRIYVAGFALGATGFPLILSYDATFAGSSEAFLAVFSSAGIPSHSTFLGGTSDDLISGVKVDASNSVYVMGYTSSLNFPTVNPYDGSYNGSSDCFITKFDAALPATPLAVSYSTFFGSAATETGSFFKLGDIGLDQTGNIYLFALTQGAIPTVNPIHAIGNGLSEPFVAKFDPTGQILLYSTILESSDLHDFPKCMHVDGDGRVYAAGFLTNSDHSKIADLDGPAGSPTADTNGYIAILAPTGDYYEAFSLIGSNAYDDINDIDVAADGSVLFCGVTRSTDPDDFPNAYDDSYGGGASDGYFGMLLPRDSDGDGELDYTDNCPFVSNASQLDGDGDGVGDACDYCEGNTSQDDFYFQEDFDSPLNPGWKWSNYVPIDATVTGGYLQVDVSAGTPIGKSNRLLIEAPVGEVQVIAELELTDPSNLDEAFIMLYGSDDYFVKLGIRAGGSPYTVFATVVTAGVVSSNAAINWNSKRSHFRISRNSIDQISFEVSSDRFNWQGISVAATFARRAYAGLATARTTGFPERTAKFYNFRVIGGDIDRDGIGDACDTCNFCAEYGDNYWSFLNSEANMWPPSAYSTVNYCNVPTPCPRNCGDCAKSLFPSWQTFVAAVGDEQAYFDPITKDFLRPSAVVKWHAIARPWEGSCFGFVSSNQSVLEDLIDVNSSFPPHEFLSNVPAAANSRDLINTYSVYQYGAIPQRLINQFYIINPSYSNNLIQESLAGDQILRTLMLFNQNGLGAHAVLPVSYTDFGDSVEYIVLDNNHPGVPKRLIIRGMDSDDTWDYEALPGWGGGAGLVLLDPVSNYLNPLQITDSICGTSDDYIQIFVGNNDSTRLSASGLGTIGQVGDSLIDNVLKGGAMIPATGTEIPPLGYYLPNGVWSCALTGESDYPIWIIECEEGSFRGGGAKSGIISAPVQAYSYDSTGILGVAGAPTAKKSPDVVASYDIEMVSILPDSEVVFRVEDIEIANGDTVFFERRPFGGMYIRNCGAATDYDILVRVVNEVRDTSCYSSTIGLGAGTSHFLTPNWRTNNDSLMIMIRSSCTGLGGFSDSIEVANEGVPAEYICGDADGNGIVTISDAVYLINYIFGGGPAPVPLLSGDVDCNGIVTISDAVYLINFIFGGGPAPCASCP